ncbi:hypothetical protein [Trichloromonas sp.]|uniref:hypothetical protein n=1 Tax=Trichloromonas sp. TaxID=3069249 RepID=UPI002A39A692|nr:hypothetical protein [Trichloromonas sp.]
MNIVSNTYFLRNLRNLDFFQLDLGKSKKIPGKEEFRKLDEFSIKYRNIYNRDILKFGRIGEKINFYEDINIQKNMFIIFKNEDIYEITYEQDDIKDLKNYLLDILRRIDEYESNEDIILEKNENFINKQDNNWEANDVKNKGKKYLIDQTLSKEEYRKRLSEYLYK